MQKDYKTLTTKPESDILLLALPTVASHSSGIADCYLQPYSRPIFLRLQLTNTATPTTAQQQTGGLG